MPIYEYRCDNCGHEFETIQKVSEDPLKTCPACAEDGLRKKISAAGFRLKGGGWYETDFKKGSKKNVAGADAAAGSSADGNGSSTGAKSEKSDGGTSSKSTNAGSGASGGATSGGGTGKSE